MNARDKGFYGGLLTAMICVTAFDEPVIIEEIMGTLSDDSRAEFIQFAKDNKEYKLAGLDKWEARMSEQARAALEQEQG